MSIELYLTTSEVCKQSWYSDSSFQRHCREIEAQKLIVWLAAKRSASQTANRLGTVPSNGAVQMAQPDT